MKQARFMRQALAQVVQPSKKTSAVFPSAFGRAVRQSFSGSGYQRLDVGANFVGEESREYEITFTSDGLLTHQVGDGGPSARVDVYGATEDDPRALLGATPLTR